MSNWYLESKTFKNLLITLNLDWLKQTTAFSFSSFIWLKAKVLYVTNNWIYTTNHKRIAVNYFLFVIFAGIVGSVLATIIRLEMAYPGVGILAGDSLQYLSVVTAHAVVMVFFMIIPLMFGAFANFLLPTQLGVHDVAFPRLNSAAFWFLPAGLLMLCQLVCLDRRYQRMNCFNIREIQSILKGRYFSDMVNAEDYHLYLDTMLLGVRFKTNDLDLNKSKITIFVNNGIRNNDSTRDSFYTNSFETKISDYTLFANNSNLYNILSLLDLYCSWFFMYIKNQFHYNTQLYPSLFVQKLNSFFLNIIYFIADISNFIVDSFSFGRAINVNNHFSSTPVRELLSTIPETSTLNNLFSQWSSITFYKSTLDLLPLDLNYITSIFYTKFINVLGFNELTFLNSNLISHFYNILSYFSYKNITQNVDNTSYYFIKLSKNWNIFGINESSLFGNTEISTNFRNQKVQNPIFRYNYKTGNYAPKDSQTLYPSMFTTISQITGGIRKPSWFFSDTFSELFESNFRNCTFFTSKTNETNPALDSVYFGSTSGFYNFFNVLSDSQNFINHRWVSVNAIDQKFYKMFVTSSMQQRIYGNWRQLKFTREAWRCKLLSARHQKTLYRRYLSEDNIFWTVEKNAKDVLPGWAMITPFAARTRFTAIGKVDIGLMGVFLVLNSSIASSANFLVTYRYLSTLNNRKMRDARSFFTEGIMVASWMMIAANPMLAIGILMLLSDRHWQTSFFDYSGGGDTVLFQHMFWFFGHPEVYVIMIPSFGFNNTILSFYLRKRVSARASLMYSMYTIAFLGFFVWGHHMYMVGLAHTTRMLFSTLTVMISVPAATKLMHWCVTLVNSSFWIELPFLFCLLFIFFFVSGGISGMAVAHTGMDILFHDSFYVIGHFHVMFAGAAMFASFGAFYFYFPSIFGVKFSRIWGYLHIFYFLLGQLMTVIPMFWLGYSGMPRRVLDYPAALGGWHAIVSAGHLLSLAGLMAFFIMIFDSIRQGRAATRNSFGVSRFNTRLNFYLYEISRNRFIQRKGWYNSRYNKPNTLSLNTLNYNNNELLETTLYSYIFVQK